MRTLYFSIAAAIFVGTHAIAQTPTAAPPKVVIDDIMVPSSDPGVDIYVRNKRLADITKCRPVLFAHGAVFPSETTFDLKLDGMSWMDYVVAHGYDVYIMDVRGFGKSTRPKEMAENRKLTRHSFVATPG
jgi:pimeloyl-ACP methyl ester carboxylesterase